MTQVICSSSVNCRGHGADLFTSLLLGIGLVVVGGILGSGSGLKVSAESPWAQEIATIATKTA